MEDQFKQLSHELNDKRDTISNILEKNGKLEIKVIELERLLNDAHQRLNNADLTINELNMLKNDIQLKNEDYIKYKHEYENEKYRR